MQELTPLLDGFSTLEAFLGPKTQPLSIRLAIQLIEQNIKKLSTANQLNCSVTRFVALPTIGRDMLRVFLMAFYWLSYHVHLAARRLRVHLAVQRLRVHLSVRCLLLINIFQLLSIACVGEHP